MQRSQRIGVAGFLDTKAPRREGFITAALGFLVGGVEDVLGNLAK